ncbi:MAG TPA: c-type cytochrome [Gammaproteobacteria bacterium]
MEKTDKQFFLTFLGVTGLLVFITVVVLVAANLIGAIGSRDEKSTAQIKMAEQRIQPVGKVSLQSKPAQDAQPVSVPAAATATAEASQDTGSRVYAGTCQACHAAGVAGAPIVGDAAAWKPRIAQGIQVLYASSLNGKGPIMLPKGGNPGLSDAEVKAAVDHMVKLSKK